MQLINQRKEQHRLGKLDRVDILSLLGEINETNVCAHCTDQTRAQSVASNLSPHIPAHLVITDDEICNHINTFLFAGSDTTSIGLAWGLLLLAQHPDMQAKLRNELVKLAEAHADNDGDTVESSTEMFALIDKLPYLDNVCREILRFIPPVHSTIRVALKDDIIPVSQPLKYESGKWKDRERHVDGIRIAKGEFIHIPIESFNLAKHIWGQDAHEFK